MNARHTEYHVARLLILLYSFASGRRRLDGLTKLAKLDFLLRYPVFLFELLQQRSVDVDASLYPTSDELVAVESRMIRYKYGPWDTKYYQLLGYLIGCELVQIHPRSEGRGGIVLSLTDRGASLAEELVRRDEWSLVHSRCQVLYRHFNISGNRLKNLIYGSLPESIDLPLRSEI